MRITKIAVKDLFGIFNHDISLNLEDHITIIHGPNGYGKTILLRLVNAIFKPNFLKIHLVPFKELSIKFDNENSLTISRKVNTPTNEKKVSGEDRTLISQFNKPEYMKPKIFKSKPFFDDINFPTNNIDKYLPMLNRIGPKNWFDTVKGEMLTLDDIIFQYGDRLPTDLPVFTNKLIPSELTKELKGIQVHFIETQRLLDISVDPRKRGYSLKHSPEMVSSVNTYSKELAEKIQSKLAEYGTMSQSLDRSFPSRLLKNTGGKSYELDKLKEELKQLEQKRKGLMETGFLEKERGIDVPELQKVDENNAHVLSVYIEDVKRKLAVFDDITEKIDLLINIINKRFLFKQLSIDKSEGFVFTNSLNKVISPTDLSSGEQHELVLLYQLLFKVAPNSLILIDEPELSLHVHWQQQFLQDLGDITKLVGFDVLIATHSPQIINDRWDLTVELKGPKQ